METASELNEQLMECIFRLFALLRRGPKLPAGEPGSKFGGRPSAQNRILLMLNESDGISQRDMTTLLQLRPQSVLHRRFNDENRENAQRAPLRLV